LTHTPKGSKTLPICQFAGFFLQMVAIPSAALGRAGL
jgi:hypothetical protein